MKAFLYFSYDLYKNKIPGNPVKKNLKILFATLPSDPFFLEAGAFNGADTLSMHYAWPKAKIHAFAPVSQIFSTLKKRIKFIKNITVYNLALSNSTGTASINVSLGKNTSASSLLEPKTVRTAYPDIKFQSKIDVNTITLNDWLKNNQSIKWILCGWICKALNYWR